MKKHTHTWTGCRWYTVKTVLVNGGMLISRPFPSLSAALAWAQFAERHGVDVKEVTIETRAGAENRPA
jgi:hypothetical protein